MNTCSHRTPAATPFLRSARPAALAAISLLAACAGAPRPAAPVRSIVLQDLVLDGATGGHQLLAAGSAQSVALASRHPARLVLLPIPTPGIASLNNISIPRSLSAPRTGLPLPTTSKESSP